MLTESTDQAAPATKPPVLFLALCAGVAVVGLTILTPAVPQVRAELKISSAAVQQLLTVYMVALAAGQLVFGPLSDRYGRRPVLLVGVVLFLLSSVVAVFFVRADVLIVLRAMQGLGAAACTAMSRAMVNDLYERDEAARQLSTMAIALAIAPALSLIFGGVLAESAGWKGSMIFLAVAGLLVMLCSIRYATETLANPIPVLDIKQLGKTYSKILSRWLFICWTLASGLQVGIFFSLNGFLAYQYQKHGYSLAEFGVWFALTPVSYIVGNSCNKRWFVKRGIARAALIGCALSLFAMTTLLVLQLAGFTHALSLALPCMLFGFSNGIVIANTTAGAVDASGGYIGTATGIVGAWQMAAGGIAGMIIIAFGGAEHFAVAGTAVVFMAVLSLTAMFIVYRHELRVLSGSTTTTVPNVP